MIRRLLILWCLCTAVARAQDGGQDSPLSGSQGVRALGVGGAVSAWLDEPAALWWNPATILYTPVRRLELQHTQNAFDTRTEQFALAMPSMDRGAWALAGVLQTTSDITITGPSSPVPIGMEDFNRFQLGAGYGVGLPKNIDAGFTLNVSGYRFMGQQRVAWGLDLGLAPFTAGAIRTGLVFRNLLRPTYSFSEGVEDTWARHVVLALAARTSRLSSGVDVDFSERQDVRFRAGAEYEVATALAVRAGYDGKAPTAGLGFRYKQFRIDYAWVQPSDLGTEHRIGLSIDIGRPIEEQRRLREERISYEVASAIEKRRTAQKPELEDKADRAMANGDWAEASSAYAQLSLLFPEEKKYATGLDAVAHKSDSANQSQLNRVTQQATTEQRVTLLDSLARAQLASRDWAAAELTAGMLGQEAGYDSVSTALRTTATDSLDAEVSRALARSRAALNDSAAVEAAGWARLALYYDSTNVEGIRLLNAAHLTGRRQASDRALLSAAASGDTAAILSTAQSVLGEFPDHALASEYLRRYTPKGAAVPIDQLQRDTEAWGWYTQGLVAFREGRFEDAIRFWEQVQARYPGSEDTKKNLDQARLRLGSKKD